MGYLLLKSWSSYPFLNIQSSYPLLKTNCELKQSVQAGNGSLLNDGESPSDNGNKEGSARHDVNSLISNLLKHGGLLTSVGYKRFRPPV